jgi:hypothetical protein
VDSAFPLRLNAPSGGLGGFELGKSITKGLEYRFIEPYVDTNTQDEHDIDQYLDSSQIKHTPKAKEDKT